MLLAFTVICGLAYPFVMTGVSQLAFRNTTGTEMGTGPDPDGRSA
jgi:K+-transporting ATPase c subunit